MSTEPNKTLPQAPPPPHPPPATPTHPPPQTPYARPSQPIPQIPKIPVQTIPVQTPPHPPQSPPTSVRADITAHQKNPPKSQFRQPPPKPPSSPTPQIPPKPPYARTSQPIKKIPPNHSSDNPPYARKSQPIKKNPPKSQFRPLTPPIPHLDNHPKNWHNPHRVDPPGFGISHNISSQTSGHSERSTGLHPSSCHRVLAVLFNHRLPTLLRSSTLPAFRPARRKALSPQSKWNSFSPSAVPIY